jgi:DNA ligase-1
MKHFTALFLALDQTTKTSEKTAALQAYFAAASARDAAWALYFLSGRKPRQVVPTKRLKQWCQALAHLPPWLFDESYQAVGDLAETIALLLPPEAESTEAPFHEWVEARVLPLRQLDEAAQRAAVTQSWQQLDRAQRLLFNKLITGGLRIGISQQLVLRARAALSGLDGAILAQRLMGEWQPTAAFYTALLAVETSENEATHSRPYPFFLAFPLEAAPVTLGNVHEWQAEWKWDGIRAQMLRRRGQSFVWSRGEELITDRFPELVALGDALPDGTALDGEIVPFKDGRELTFQDLQKRIGRQQPGAKLLSDVPVIFKVYDQLEAGGVDWRATPLSERRQRLEGFHAALPGEAQARCMLSPIVHAESWESLAQQREQSRALGVEGLMLKRLTSPYRIGRQRGDWWKWKIEPFTLDAVLLYAQRGHGRRANLYTDYTFGVWKGGELVPFAKAYSGLTDEEIAHVDRFVRQNTRESFGPVRSVKPELVFELAFEGLQRSNRHKSGIAVRFPRMLRWRHDKPIVEADSLETIYAMLDAQGKG